MPTFAFNLTFTAQTTNDYGRKLHVLGLIKIFWSRQSLQGVSIRHKFFSFTCPINHHDQFREKFGQAHEKITLRVSTKCVINGAEARGKLRSFWTRAQTLWHYFGSFTLLQVSPFSNIFPALLSDRFRQIQMSRKNKGTEPKTRIFIWKVSRVTGSTFHPNLRDHWVEYLNDKVYGYKVYY